MDMLDENVVFDNEPTAETLAFYRAHCETSPKHILLVTAFFPPCDCGEDHCDDDEETQVSNVFSSLEAAAKWIEELEDGASVYCAPIVIDDPMFEAASASSAGDTVN